MVFTYIYIDYLREKLDKSEDFSWEEIDGPYRDIADTFINTPFEKYEAKPSPYLGNPTQAAREVLNALSSLDNTAP